MAEITRGSSCGWCASVKVEMWPGRRQDVDVRAERDTLCLPPPNDGGRYRWHEMIYQLDRCADRTKIVQSARCRGARLPRSPTSHQQRLLSYSSIGQAWLHCRPSGRDRMREAAGPRARTALHMTQFAVLIGSNSCWGPKAQGSHELCAPEMSMSTVDDWFRESTREAYCKALVVKMPHL